MRVMSAEPALRRPSRAVSLANEQEPFPLLQDVARIIQLAVLMHIRFALSLRNVEDLLHERGIDVCHESVRLWVDRFGNHFASKIRRQTSACDQICILFPTHGLMPQIT